jgi:hypothetical protein
VHDAPAWVIVNVWPPAVIVPVRADVLGFAATLKVTAPLPEPLDPLVIVIQLAESVAVHAQPLPAVTLKDPVPPSADAE